ncbi:MAG: Clp1/GlmU family protein [Candidatus Bathyarchaeia archaeon]
MIKTVEKGRTLLVDGPASVTVTSGLVDVFGAVISGKSKVVIREGKRLPFTAEEKTEFDISLGENASVEEVDGNTIPHSWNEAFNEVLKIKERPTVLMVIGNVDSGKSSFCTYIVNRLLNEKYKVAVLDGDLGQSDIGPPCSVAYNFVTKLMTDLFNLEAKNAFFVGVTSPSSAIDKVIEGLVSLKKEILDGNPDFIVVNTDGWIEGEDAVNYKIRLVNELMPNIVLCIKQGDEITPLINALEDFRKLVVESPRAIKQRSREKRKSLRELGYIKYLKNAKVQSIPLSWINIEGNELLNLSKISEKSKRARIIYDLLGMKPLHFVELKDKIYVVIGKSRWINDENVRRVEQFVEKRVEVIRKGQEEGALTALYSSERKFLGIGVLQEVDYLRKTLKILTPVSKEIATIVVGKVKLDKNLKETPFFENASPQNYPFIQRL